MKLIIFLIVLCFSFSVFALSKADIKKSLDQMRATGMFTEAQIQAAEKQLMGMDQKTIDSLVQQGKQKANDPEVQKKAQELLQKYKAQQAGGQ